MRPIALVPLLALFTTPSMADQKQISLDGDRTAGTFGFEVSVPGLSTDPRLYDDADPNVNERLLPDCTENVDCDWASKLLDSDSFSSDKNKVRIVLNDVSASSSETCSYISKNCVLRSDDTVFMSFFVAEERTTDRPKDFRVKAWTTRDDVDTIVDTGVIDVTTYPWTSASGRDSANYCPADEIMDADEQVLFKYSSGDCPLGVNEKYEVSVEINVDTNLDDSSVFIAVESIANEVSQARVDIAGCVGAVSGCQNKFQDPDDRCCGSRCSTNACE